MIVGNFTPDPVDWMHIGISGTIKPGETVEWDEGRARHILNNFARRGLVQMQFGDEPEDKKKESMRLWVGFWEQQITAFNQHNEDQKEKGNRYARPTPELLEKAKTLGLELLQPWRIEKTDDKQIKALMAENVALKDTVTEQSKQISEQSGQINEILEMLKAGQTGEAITTPEPAPEEATLGDVMANKKKYASLGVKTMAAWLKNNWDEYLGMPQENRFEIETRYQELYQTPFPEDQPA